MMMNRNTLFLIALFCFEITSSLDWFEIADANHDGLLDRTEYDVGLDKVLLELKKSAATNSTSMMQSLYEWFVPPSEGGFWKGFTSSLAMILATEVGDKTFFIAAVLSMKHDRWAVFTGAFFALVIMTVLSTAMGLVLPKFLERQYTHFLSGALFLYFGVKLLYDSRAMQGGKASEELEEVEEELLQQGSKKTKKTDHDEESGTMRNKSAVSTTAQSIIMTAFSLTLVAEWGDRSQIATIALASSKNPFGVTLGGLLGHAICTSAACMGGRMLASSISEKTISQFGGLIFLIFGFHSLFLEE